MSASKIELSKEDYEKLLNEQSNIFISTMIDIYGERASKIMPSTILKNYETKYNIFQPASSDPQIYNDITRDFYNSVSDVFECIELSPINPFALNSVLTETNQNNVLSALRNAEVVSDSSIAMALECAYRIKKGEKSNINLASSTRLLRMQNYGNGKKSHWSQHFRACSLVSSFRNVNENMYSTIILQISSWLKIIKELNLDINSIDVNVCYLPLVKEIYSFFDIDESVLLNNSVNPDFDIFKVYNVGIEDKIGSMEQIDKIQYKKDYLLSIKNAYKFLNNKILGKLKEENPQINFYLHLNRKSGLNYYDNICYEVVVHFSNGKDLVLVDGGVTNWTGQLLSDSKEKCVTSGMGLEYISKVYKKKL